MLGTHQTSRLSKVLMFQGKPQHREQFSDPFQTDASHHLPLELAVVAADTRRSEADEPGEQFPQLPLPAPPPTPVFAICVSRLPLFWEKLFWETKNILWVRRESPRCQEVEAVCHLGSPGWGWGAGTGWRCWVGGGGELEAGLQGTRSGLPCPPAYCVCPNHNPALKVPQSAF